MSMRSLSEQPLQLSKPVSFDVTPLQRYLEFRHGLTGARLAGEFRTAGHLAEQIIQVRLSFTAIIFAQKRRQEIVKLAEIAVDASHCFPNPAKVSNSYKDLVEELVRNLKFLPYAVGHLNYRLCELRARRDAEKSLEMDITPITYVPGTKYSQALEPPTDSFQSYSEDNGGASSVDGTVQTPSRSLISRCFTSLKSSFSGNTH